MNTSIEKLTIEVHGDFKKIKNHHFPHVQSEQLVPINMHEFPAASSCFPLFFIKNKNNGQLFSIALFGLIQNENLYYSPQEWQASYVPLAMRTWPFSLVATDPEKKKWHVAADTTSDYLSETKGDSLFTLGKPSELFNTITKELVSNSQQKAATVSFIDFITQQNLIKAIKFEFVFATGEKHQAGGIYAINEDVLNNLQPEQVQELYKRDYFKAIYCMLSSQHNLYDLIKRSQAKSSDKSVVSLNIISD
ncbi:SapC family protein [Colwellia sp. 4_MG-2023]|uniref:SapC family protein n=1 Tax=unclassified Colwellia TaxID=196834 RepID=UPI0026E27342|nr:MULTISPECIES: SapC family protein [unclassified Colwellia]MDO6506603.1 SapC family protein [Colwellia sp. 5_MG-2023]MDO6555090.1 SapC family protein [Colwellia sp. 4_MG-2023]